MNSGKIESLRLELKETETQLKTTTEKLNFTLTELENTQGKVSKLEGQSSNMFNELNNLKVDKMEALSKVEDLTIKLDATVMARDLLKSENETLQTDMLEQQIIRQRLRNEIVDMKGKVRVYCRVRPFNKAEIERNDEFCLQFADMFSIKVARPDHGGVKYSNFEFDSVFTPKQNGTQVFFTYRLLFIARKISLRKQKV